MKRCPQIPSGIRRKLAIAYAGGMSSTKVGAKFGVSWSTVLQCANEMGVKTRGWRESKQSYTLNERAFDVLTPEAAYWIGFLITDGAVSGPASPVLLLHLKASDVSHIRSLRKFIGSNHPIKINKKPKRYKRSYNSSAYARLNLRCGRHMARTLDGYGVTLNKTLTARAADCLVDSPDFWRGVIDGDGSIYTTRRTGRSHPAISLCSASRKFAEQFREFARRNIPDYYGRVATNARSFDVRLCGANAIKLIDLLYRGAIPALPRKARRAKKILAIADEDPLWCRRNDGPRKGWARKRGAA